MKQQKWYSYIIVIKYYDYIVKYINDSFIFTSQCFWSHFFFCQKIFSWHSCWHYKRPGRFTGQMYEQKDHHLSKPMISSYFLIPRSLCAPRLIARENIPKPNSFQTPNRPKQKANLSRLEQKRPDEGDLLFPGTTEIVPFFIRRQEVTNAEARRQMARN